MEPEDYLWFHLAHELKWPVSLLKQVTTVGEFEKSQTYFTMRRAQHDKSDWYHAAMIRAISYSQSTKPAGPVSDFLLEFEGPKPVATNPPQTKDDPLSDPESFESKMKANQALWISLMGARTE